MAAVPTPLDRDNTPDRLRAVLAGDDTAWQELFNECHPFLKSLLRGLCQDEHLAEDLTQESLVAFFCVLCPEKKSPDDFPNTDGFHRFLKSIARNRWRSHCRRRRKVQTIDPIILDRLRSEEAVPGFFVELEELKTKVSEFLAMLEDSDRRIFEMKIFGGHSDQKIAKELGSKRETIRNRRYAILAKARVFFKDHHG